MSDRPVLEANLKPELSSSADTITSAAELDALPERTLAENEHTLIRKDINGWFTLSEVGGSFWWDSVAIAERGPWTVLYRPDRRTPGVLPSVEEVARAFLDAYHAEPGFYDQYIRPYMDSAHINSLHGGGAVLALLPGRPEREVLEQGWDERDRARPQYLGPPPVRRRRRPPARRRGHHLP